MYDDALSLHIHNITYTKTNTYVHIQLHNYLFLSIYIYTVYRITRFVRSQRNVLIWFRCKSVGPLHLSASFELDLMGCSIAALRKSDSVSVFNTSFALQMTLSTIVRCSCKSIAHGTGCDHGAGGPTRTAMGHCCRRGD